MTRKAQPDDLATKTLVLRVTGMEDVSVLKDVPYGETGVLDLYRPRMARSACPPAVLLVAGYPDGGFEARLGCKFKDMGASTSWARLLAASGLAAVTYTNQHPSEDVDAVLVYLRNNARSLGIDGRRLGLWASSGNVPTALSLFMASDTVVTCAVFCYGFLLDLDGSTAVADAARQWGFANPCAGKSFEDVPLNRSLFVVRAGRDTFAGVQPSIDAFVSHGLARNLSLMLVNHPEGCHAFDLLDDTETSREILRQGISFLQFHLAGSVTRNGSGPG